jgi:hypothetical protein
MGTPLYMNFMNATGETATTGWPCDTNKQKKTAKRALELKLEGKIPMGGVTTERFTQVLKHVHMRRNRWQEMENKA